MKRRLMIYMMILEVFTASCISSKDIQKNKTKSVSEVKLSESVNTLTDINAVTVTQATNTVKTTETIDTNACIPGSQVKGQKDLEDLQNGIPLVIENGDQQVSVQWDAKTKSIIASGTLKDRIIPVKGKRETISSSASITNEAKQTKTQISDKKDSTASTFFSSDTKIKNVTYSQKWIFIILAIVAAVAFLGFLAFKFLRKVP
jgi:hypothetical protein